MCIGILIQWQDVKLFSNIKDILNYIQYSFCIKQVHNFLFPYYLVFICDRYDTSSLMFC